MVSCRDETGLLPETPNRSQALCSFKKAAELGQAVIIRSASHVITLCGNNYGRAIFRKNLAPWLSNALDDQPFVSASLMSETIYVRTLQQLRGWKKAGRVGLNIGSRRTSNAMCGSLLDTLGKRIR